MDGDDFFDAFPRGTNFDRTPYMIVKYVEVDDGDYVDPEGVQIVVGTSRCSTVLQEVSANDANILFAAFPVLPVTLLE